jgi:DNA-binding transcriptional ArsR family regulator
LTDSIGIITHRELAERPPTEFAIDGILPERCLASLYGAPRSYKTFIAISMAASLATGRSWNGREVRRKRVLYIIAEGVSGFGKRLDAWTDDNTKEYLPSSHFLVVPTAVNLLDPTEVAELVKKVKEVFADAADGLFIFIDTVARNFGGGDENSTQDMNVFIKHVDYIREELNAGILLVHHTGKDPTKGGRGSSALLGALDVEMVSIRPAESDYTTLKCNKQKDDEEFAPIALGVKKMGESLVLTTAKETSILQRKPGQAKRPKLKATVWAILQALMATKANGEDAVAGNLCEDLGISIRTLERHVEWLERHQIVAVSGDGRDMRIGVYMEEALLFEKA